MCYIADEGAGRVQSVCSSSGTKRRQNRRKIRRRVKALMLCEAGAEGGQFHSSTVFWGTDYLKFIFIRLMNLNLCLNQNQLGIFRVLTRGESARFVDKGKLSEKCAQSVFCDAAWRPEQQVREK